MIMVMFDSLLACHHRRMSFIANAVKNVETYSLILQTNQRVFDAEEVTKADYEKSQ